MPTSEQALSEWIKLFPKRTSEDSINSAAFIKQFTVVVISIITYMKDAIPRDNYLIESFEDIKLHILKKKCRNGVAQFLVSALTFAFDALDKQYLHKLTLCFYKDERKHESLIECHIFEYLYKNNGVTMSVQSTKHSMEYTFETIREQTIKLLKFYIILMESSEKLLPNSYGVSLLLNYHEGTPADCHAPGFMCATDQIDPHKCVNLKKIKCELNTRFQRLVVSSYVREQTDGLEPSDNAITNQSGSKAISAAGRQLVCPCNNYSSKDVYKPHELLTCWYCKTQQHAPCYGVRRPDARLVTRHCCVRCHDADGARRPTDLRLTNIGPEKRTILCLFRRALEHCVRRADVSARTLVDQLSVPQPTARELMRILGECGVVQQPCDPNISQEIVNEKLNEVLSLFLSARDVRRRCRRCAAPLKRCRRAPADDELPANAFAKIRKRNELTLNLSTRKASRAQLPANTTK